MLAPVPDPAELPGVHVFGLYPTPAGITPQIPDDLLALFLQEVSREPHFNPLVCSQCGDRYSTSSLQGKPCTARRGSRSCDGVIDWRWTQATARNALVEHLHRGGVALARTKDATSTPVGFCICEPHTPDTVIVAIGTSMRTLSPIYERLGRDGLYLVLTHLAIHTQSRELVQIFRELVMKPIEFVMRQMGLNKAGVLVPVDSRPQELRHKLLRDLLGRTYKVISSDTMGGRHHAVVATHVGPH